MYKDLPEVALVDVFNFESTDLFCDEISPQEDAAVEHETDKKRALNGRKEYTNMRHVWTDGEERKLLAVYLKQKGHVDSSTVDRLVKDMRKGITPAHINKFFKTLRAHQRASVKVAKTHRRDGRFTKAM